MTLCLFILSFLAGYFLKYFYQKKEIQKYKVKVESLRKKLDKIIHTRI